MTAAHYTPARRPTFFRRAAVAVGLALGIVLSPLPAPAAEGATLSYTIAGATVTAPSWGAKVAVWTALGQRGDPYVWGGAGPSSFDCSGLTQYAWGRAGVYLPHSSRMQSTMGYPVSKSSLLPGDLVFFYSPVSHVGIYTGNGQMVHAPTSGDVVKVGSIDSMGGYAGARRVA